MKRIFIEKLGKFLEFPDWMNEDQIANVLKDKINYVHNTEKNPFSKSQGRFAMDVEPAGQYITPTDTLRQSEGNLIAGQKQFKQPLVIEYGGMYDETSNWKRQLSERYGGLTGKRLTNALRKDGYDGIITIDNKGNMSESVDLYKGKGGVDMKSAAPTAIAGTLGYNALSSDEAEAGVLGKTGKNIWHHGSPNDFDFFDNSFLGQNTGAKDADKGFYFAGSKRTSNEYLDNYLAIDEKRFKETFGVSLDDAERQLEEAKQTLLEKGIDPENISIKDELRLNREAYNHGWTPASEEALAFEKYKNIERNLNPYSLEKKDKRLVQEKPLGQTVTAELDGNYLEVDMGGEPWNEAFQNQKAKEALEEGYDGVVYRNMQDSGWFGGTGTDDIVQTFDTKNIKILEIAKKYGIAPGAVTASMLAYEDGEVLADDLLTTPSFPEHQSKVIPVKEGFEGVHDAGMWLQQNLPTPIGGTWFEGLGDYLTDLAEGQEKSAFEKYVSGLFATLDILP